MVLRNNQQTFSWRSGHERGSNYCPPTDRPYLFPLGYCAVFVSSSNESLNFQFTRNLREKRFKKAVQKEQRLRTNDLLRKHTLNLNLRAFRLRTATEPL